MGKQLEKLILILGIILIGTAVFAEQISTDVLDNPVLVTREKKKEEVKEPTKKLQPPKTTPCCKNQNKTKTAKKAKPSKPQYLGLKIYEIEKPKPKTKKIAKIKCKDDPTSICNIRKLKPRTSFKTEKPRYTRKYNNNRYDNDRYKKYKLPDYPTAKPAKPIPIITCY